MHALSKLFEALHLTRKDKLSGGHYRRRRQTSRRSSFLSCETLESKQLLAADVAQAFATTIELDTTDPVTVAIEGKFQEDTVSGTVVKFETNAPVSDSDIFIELTSDTPLTNDNFLQYVNNDDYDNTFFHRSVAGFALQGGGFTAPTVAADQAGSDPLAIVPRGTVQNEPVNLNTRGTIAMAKLGGLPDSATSQFFFNLNNNSFLDSDNGGYTVFGEVLGSGMSVVDTMALAPTYDATTYYANSALAELPIYNTFSDNIIRPNDFLKIENADVVTESDLMNYVVSSSDAAKLTASFDGNGDLVLTPNASATGSVDVTVTATSKLDNLSDSQTFSVQLNGGGGPVAPVLTPIESVGNTVLNRDQNDNLYAGTTLITLNNAAVTTTRFSLAYVGAETVNGNNYVLMRRNSNNVLQYWSMDTNWAWQGTVRDFGSVGSELYDIEAAFGVDLNNDSATGQPPYQAIESDGSVTLQTSNANNGLYAGTTLITLNNVAVTTTRYSLTYVGAETVNGNNYVLMRRNSNNVLQYWSMDTNWAWQGTVRDFRSVGSELYDIEAAFGVDLNNDSATGQPPYQAIESDGSVTLQTSNANNGLYAGTTLITLNNVAVTTTRYSLTYVGAETVNGNNYVMMRRNSNNVLQYWSMDTNWAWQGTVRDFGSVGSELYDIEAAFGVDLDGNELIGS